MSRLIKQYLLAFLLALGMVGTVYAAATKFTDVQCRNLTVSGSISSGACTCTNISTTTLNASDLNATYGVTGATGTFTSVSIGTATLSGAQGLRLGPGSITAATTVPAAANILAHDSSNVLYISTGTGAGAWVKVGGQ